MSGEEIRELRRRLRARLGAASPAVGTFVKLPTVDCLDLARQAGLDFVVIDTEHSLLAEETVTALLRHACAIDLPALVRVPSVDGPRINRLLEAGATGIQLSMLRGRDDVEALLAATRYPPYGLRSVSLAHPAADFGAAGLAGYLTAEADCPPVLVGQLETATTRNPLVEVLADLDVAFVGTTDLAVSLGVVGSPDQQPLLTKVREIAAAARSVGVALGGWVADADARSIARVGLERAGYLVAGSDLQFLGASLRAVAHEARRVRGAGTTDTATTTDQTTDKE